MEHKGSFFTDFKKFISRGSVIDLAVGVIIGGAFTAIVTAISQKIIMPFINFLLSFGGSGLDSAFTFLKKVYLADGSVDLVKSIYIDWGAFISSVINFLIIAFILFSILRFVMKSKGYLNKKIKEYPTRKERKEFKKQGIKYSNREELLKITQEYREKNKPKPVPIKPTQEELLAQILQELKNKNTEAEKIEEK